METKARSNLHLTSFKRGENIFWRIDGCDFFKIKKDINFQIKQIKRKFTSKYSESAKHERQREDL